MIMKNFNRRSSHGDQGSRLCDVNVLTPFKQKRINSKSHLPKET